MATRGELSYYVHGGSAWLRQILKKGENLNTSKKIAELIIERCDDNVSKGVSFMPQNWDISIFCEE